MGARVLEKARQREFLAAGPASQLVLPLKDDRLQPGIGQVTGDDRPLMTSSNNYGVVTSISH